MMLKNGIILYHGSYAKIENVNLEKCLDGKDFGTGFYLTSDYAQAVNTGYVTKFIFNKNCDIAVYDFKKADKNWLHFVAGNRKKGIFEDEVKRFQNYDIIIGKIANDATNRVITAYLNNAYGEVGSHFADRTAISLLLPNKLSNQFCFKTQDSLSCLEFVEAVEVEV